MNKVFHKKKITGAITCELLSTFKYAAQSPTLDNRHYFEKIYDYSWQGYVLKLRREIFKDGETLTKNKKKNLQTFQKVEIFQNLPGLHKDETTFYCNVHLKNLRNTAVREKIKNPVKITLSALYPSIYYI